MGTGRVYSTFAWAFFDASYRHQKTIRSGAAFLEDREWVEIVHQTSRPIDITINAQVAIPIPIMQIGKSDPYSESIGWVGSKWSTEKTANDVFEAISRLISGNGLSPSSPSYPQLDDPQDPQENEFAEVSETESFSIGSNAGCNMLLFFKVNPSSGYSFGAGL